MVVMLEDAIRGAGFGADGPAGPRVTVVCEISPRVPRYAYGHTQSSRTPQRASVCVVMLEDVDDCKMTVCEQLELVTQLL